MIIETEALPKDGAAYRCNVTVSIKNLGPWRCPRECDRGLTPASYVDVLARVRSEPWITVDGRALCNSHLEMLETDL